MISSSFRFLILPTLLTVASSTLASGRVVETDSEKRYIDQQGVETSEDQYAVAGAWGKGDISFSNPNEADHRMIVDKQGNWPSKFKFEWWWPRNNQGNRQGRVKAFYYVGTGFLNSDGKYYDRILPRRLWQIPNHASVEAKLRFDRGTYGARNYSINMMTRGQLTGNNPAYPAYFQQTREGFTNEIHIYEWYNGSIPNNADKPWTNLGVYTIPGTNVQYQMRKITNGNRKQIKSGLPYYQAWRIKKSTGGAVALGHILRYFRTNAGLPSSAKLSFIRVGVEVNHGAGGMRLEEVEFVDLK